MGSKHRKRVQLNTISFLKNHRELAFVAFLAVLIPVIYIIVIALSISNYEIIKASMLSIVIFSALAVGFSYFQNNFSSQELTKYIIFLGIVMRIGYMLYTDCTVRSHDLGELSIDGRGHAAYIFNILDGHLPVSNEGQFYHPPLYYILSATVISVVKPILNLSDPMDIINCARIVSCISSCATLVCVKLLLGEADVKKGINVSMLLAAFLPNFYLMSGRVNNDSLAVFFMSVIFLYSIKWYKKQSFKNTFILAMAFALGMLTKVSVAMLAIPTGVLMLYVFIKNIRQKQILSTLKTAGLFAVVSLPLGMSYCLRNLIRFNQSFNYILDVGSSEFSSQNYEFVDRFLSFPVSGLLRPIYTNVHMDYNVWMYLLKCSLFGEFSYNVKEAIPVLLILVYTLIVIIMLITSISVYLVPNICNFYLKGITIFGIISYIVCNISYPYGCTMDFRYFIPVFIVGLVFLGKMLYRETENRFLKAAQYISGILCGAFSILSVLMFCLI